jgi:uncharacterized protein
MISIKIYHQGEDLVIGACDEELLGKKFKKGKLQIDCSKRFYDGERIDTKKLEQILNDATIANLVGEKAVKCAIKLGLVDPECILKIKGIPHAQMIPKNQRHSSCSDDTNDLIFFFCQRLNFSKHIVIVCSHPIDFTAGWATPKCFMLLKDRRRYFTNN